MRLNHTQLGEAVGRLHLAAVKQGAEAPRLSYALRGRLYLSSKGWLLLSVPNAIGRGAFQAMNIPGAELPISETTGQYNAHVSVMRPEEIEQLGGADRVKERGKDFSFTLGPVREINPAGWEEMDRCWYIEIHSPDLERLRKSYGLTALPKNNEYQFHLTFAVKRKGVTRENGLRVFRGGELVHAPSRIFDDQYTQKEAASNFTIRESGIAGEGVFAAKEMSPAFEIGLAATLSDDGRVMRQPLLAKINHSSRPNTVLRVEDGNVLLVADQVILPGDELTVDYVDGYSVLGVDTVFDDGSTIESNNDIFAKKANRYLAAILATKEESCVISHAEKNECELQLCIKQAQPLAESCERHPTTACKESADLNHGRLLLDAVQQEPLLPQGVPSQRLLQVMGAYPSRVLARANRLQAERTTSDRLLAAMRGDHGLQQSTEFLQGKRQPGPSVFSQLVGSVR